MFVIVLRLIVLFAILAGVYIALSIYLRWDRRKQLEEEHAEEGSTALSREDYVARGLARYERSWERRAIWGVFLVPIAVVVLLVLIANYQ